MISNQRPPPCKGADDRSRDLRKQMRSRLDQRIRALDGFAKLRSISRSLAGSSRDRSTDWPRHGRRRSPPPGGSVDEQGPSRVRPPGTRYIAEFALARDTLREPAQRLRARCSLRSREAAPHRHLQQQSPPPARRSTRSSPLVNSRRTSRGPVVQHPGPARPRKEGIACEREVVQSDLGYRIIIRRTVLACWCTSAPSRVRAATWLDDSQGDHPMIRRRA